MRLLLTGDECGLIKEISITQTNSSSSSTNNERPNGVSSDSEGLLQQQRQQQQQQRIINPQDGMTRQHGLVRMLQWENSDTTTNSRHTIAALRKNGSIQLWEQSLSSSSSSSLKKQKHHKTTFEYSPICTTIPNVFQQKNQHVPNERPLNMGRICSTSSSSSAPTVILGACSTNGTIAIVKLPRDSSRNEEKDDDGTVPSTRNSNSMDDVVVQTFSTTTSSLSSSSFVPTTTTTNTNDFIHTIPLRISTFATHPTLPYVVMGGKDRDMVLYDIQQSRHTHSTASSTAAESSSSSSSSLLQPIWKAKNLPPHPQTLLQPQIWPTACCFLQPHILMVGTAYRQIRIYDIRMSASSQVGTTISSSSAASSPHSKALSIVPQPTHQQQRRPILYSSQPMLDYRITAICPLSNHNTVIVGDAGGTMVSIDVRQLKNIHHSTSKTNTNHSTSNHRLSTSAITGRYIGPTGCISDIVELHSSSSKSSSPHCIASVGYDRMVRIYNTKSKQQVHQIYCKQRLNCILPVLDDDDNDNDDEYDEEYANHTNVNMDHVEENDDDDIVKDYKDSSDDDSEDDLSVENEDDVVNEMTATRSRKNNNNNNDDDDDDDERNDGNDEDALDSEDIEDGNDFDDAPDEDEEEEDEQPIRKRNRQR